MRVTDRWSYERNTLELGRARERHAEAQSEVSSGTRVTHPWDDPSAAGLGASHDAAERRYGAVIKTLGRASDELTTADASLGEVVEALSRAHELSVQLSNDTYSAQDRATAASEIDGLMQSVVMSLNKQVGGRYVFGGTQDQTPPFNAAGAYLGDTQIRQVEVSPGAWQDVSVRADIAIKGVGGGVDVLSTLSALSTALSTNDTTTLRASIDALHDGIAQVAKSRTLAGAQMSVVEVANSALRASQDDERGQVSRELDADIFSSASRMAAAERALEAAISATARSGKLSLLDKM